MNANWPYIEEWLHYAFTVGETQAPVTTAEAVTGFGGHIKAVVTLTADDGPGWGSGVATTEYRINGGDWTTYDGPVLVGGGAPPRAVVFEYRSIDANGNIEETNTLTFTPVGKHG